MPVDEGDWPADAAFAAQHDSVTETGQIEDPPPVDGDTRGLVLESHPAGDEEANAGITEFDPRHREDFEGLLFLGRLTHDFSYVGHTFTIKTLTTDKFLEVGLLTRPYVGTLGESRAFTAAIVAACTVEVDGVPMPVPITNDPKDSDVANRFRYVLRSWYPPVIDAVYDQFLLLEKRVDETLASMGEAPR